MILYHSIRLQYIGTDLVSPANLLHFASDIRKLLCIGFLLQHIQLGLQHLHRLVLILELGTLILTLYYDSGRNVGNTDSR